MKLFTNSSVYFFTVIAFVMLTIGGCKKDTTNNSTDNFTDPKVKPKVIFTIPSDNAQGPFSNLYNFSNGELPHFVVRFNKYMDLSTFSGKITIKGFGDDYTINVRNEYSNVQYTDLVLFRVYTPENNNYLKGKTYKVTVHSGIKDINGNILEDDYTFSYVPEPYFRLLGSYPRDSSFLNPYDDIQLTFNSKVSSSIFSHLQITPSVSGNWDLSSDSTSTFFFPTDSGFNFNQTYTIQLSANARDASGTQVNKGKNIYFYTDDFHISWTQPYDGALFVDRQQPIYIVTNGIIDTNTIANAFSISPTVSGNFLHNNFPSNSFYFRPDSNGFAWLQTYTVTISTALHTSNGTPLSTPYTFQFTTRP